MKKFDKRRNKKIKKLIVISVLCAIIFSVSTYAWFIGMKTVSVDNFEIDIATTEGLYLSMDGDTWSYRLDPKTAAVYDDNTNMWADNGLIPISSVGDMDANSSRLKLFEKGSITATPGGYRLLTSRIDNYNADGDTGKFKQGKGYIVFDLFIKNLSGTEYYEDNEQKNEEAIYLTTNSEVTVGSTGVSNTGIENSVRVAFAQVGRVKADAASTVITNITCDDDETSEVTGICRNARIWEPNDTKHVSNAIKWYNKSCVARKNPTQENADIGKDVIDEASYYLAENETENKACATVEDATASPTYAISRVIGIDDNVNVYDGTKFNKYTNNSVDYATYDDATADVKSDYKLVDFPYFTDTMRDKKGTERSPFMTLAPNSVTKVRVYVWIEGQDIDNYDFASLGGQVAIKFGFTKERYTETDVDYHGPTTDITDVVEGS